MAEDSTHSSHHASSGVSKKMFFAGLAALLLVFVIGFAILYNKAPAATQPSGDSAALTALSARVSAIEQKLVPPAVSLKVYYNSKDPFSEPALAQIAAAQQTLTDQGLKIELEDAAGKLDALKKQGFSSLPAIYISEQEAVKNPSLYAALQKQPKVTGGYKIPVLGFLTSIETMISLECKPSNSSARLFEFGNPACPQCESLSAAVANLSKEFGSKLEISFKQYPAGQADAYNASQAVKCAAVQSPQKSAQFQGKLLQTQAIPGEWLVGSNNQTQPEATALEKFGKYATDVGLNATQLSACIVSPQSGNMVESDTSEGITSYEIPQNNALLPVFVVDCKYVFAVEKPADLKEAVCRARPELCK